MINVLMPLANGFEDMEAVTVIDVLRRGGVQVITASLNSTTEVMGARGIPMVADALLQDVIANEYDAIVLPSGSRGVDNLKQCEPLLERIRQQRGAGRLIAAICAGPLVLLEAGVIQENTHFTCYPTCQMEINRPVADAPVVADNGIITGQAPGSSLLFALIVLNELCGRIVAKNVAHGMVTDVFD